MDRRHCQEIESENVAEATLGREEKVPTYKVLPAYENVNPKTPKPLDGGIPYFVTVQDGVPVIY